MPANNSWPLQKITPLIRILCCAIYVFGGSTIFMVIEETSTPAINEKLTLTRLKQVNTTARFNMSRAALDDLVRALTDATNQDPEPWDYGKAAAFAIHLVTTIGYGNITPKTTAGQMVTIAYGLIGIPLTLLMLKSIGQHYNNRMRRFVVWIETSCLERAHVDNLEAKIAVVNAFGVVSYMCLGAALTKFSEGWTFAEGIYVWFITFSTVGFGDYVPNSITRLVETAIGLCLMSGLIDSLVSYSEKVKCAGCLQSAVSEESGPADNQSSPTANRAMELENRGFSKT